MEPTPPTPASSGAGGVDIAELELSRLERDYLATVNARPIDRANPGASAPHDEEDDDAQDDAGGADAGYTMLGDDELESEGDDVDDEAPDASDGSAELRSDEDAPRAAAAPEEGSPGRDGVRTRPEEASFADGAVETAAPWGADGSGATFEAVWPSNDAVAPPRDIALTDDKRTLITSIMSGFEIKGAGEWSARFSANAQGRRS